MLKDYKKANKKEVKTVSNVSLTRIVDGCCWNDLYKEFEKENNLKIVEIKNDWLCCVKGCVNESINIRYKICPTSYIMNYDGVLNIEYK